MKMRVYRTVAAVIVSIAFLSMVPVNAGEPDVGETLQEFFDLLEKIDTISEDATTDVTTKIPVVKTLLVEESLSAALGEDFAKMVEELEEYIRSDDIYADIDDKDLSTEEINIFSGALEPLEEERAEQVLSDVRGDEKQYSDAAAEEEEHT